MPPCGRHPHHRLTDLVARRAGPGRHADGDGLYLFVRPNGARSWVQRLVIAGRRRDLGLGGYPLVPLAEARRAAADNRRVARSGGDPRAPAARGAVPSLRDAVEAVIAVRRSSWRTPGPEWAWRRLFDRFVFPRLGDVPVDQITLKALTDIVSPHWKGRNSRGSLLRQHLERVMEWAIVHGHRADNPARQLTVLLPHVKVAPNHRPSLPYPKVREAMVAVRASPGDDALKLALLFTVLCASRIGEVMGARWEEIDLDAGVWTIPAHRMKALRPHKVPLSAQARSVLERARALGRCVERVFVLRGRAGRLRVIDSKDFSEVLRPLGYVDEHRRPIVMHGFRTTFRVWAVDVEGALRETCEAALAHVEGDRTVASYARTDLFNVRRRLMQSWADYVVPQAAC